MERSHNLDPAISRFEMAAMSGTAPDALQDAEEGTARAFGPPGSHAALKMPHATSVAARITLEHPDSWNGIGGSRGLLGANSSDTDTDTTGRGRSTARSNREQNEHRPMAMRHRTAVHGISADTARHTPDTNGERQFGASHGGAALQESSVLQMVEVRRQFRGLLSKLRRGQGRKAARDEDEE